MFIEITQLDDFEIFKERSKTSKRVRIDLLVDALR